MTAIKIQEQQDLKIQRAITAHEEWKNKWTKKDRCFSPEWVSPRGKSMTYSGYCSEVNKHMAQTIAKIRKILEVTE